jgi:hypothetical protein
MPDLAFVLVSEPRYPDPASVIESARTLGIELGAPSGDSPLSFELPDGGAFMVMLVEAPHPDVPHMPAGPTSPSPDEAAAAPAHMILTALGLDGQPRERDTVMAKLTAAVIQSTNAVGAMLGHGVVFHKAGLFADMAGLAAEEGLLPPEVAIDITAAAEPDERMSFLTHGMERYGREEFFITCPIQGKGALDFVFGLVRWLLTDLEKQLPTGDTIGRTAEEKILVQRVPNPTGSGSEVIRLDLQS